MQTRSLIGMQVLQSNPTKIFAPTKDSDLVAQLETQTFSNCALKRTDLSTFLSQFFFNSLFLKLFFFYFFLIYRTEHKDQIYKRLKGHMMENDQQLKQDSNGLKIN
jgi:hypothetical protein